MKAKTFKDIKSMNSFIKQFKEQYPPDTNRPTHYGDSWIELAITDINGSITSMDTLEIT